MYSGYFRHRIKTANSGLFFIFEQQSHKIYFGWSDSAVWCLRERHTSDMVAYNFPIDNILAIPFDSILLSCSAILWH